MVLLTGGVLSGLLALALTRLPTSEQAGATVYVIPGSDGRKVLDPAIITVLGGVAALFGGLAIVALLALMRPPSALPQVAAPSSIRPRRRMPKRVLAGGILLLVLVPPIRWYGYVTSPPTTRNRVGSWLNAHAPGPVRNWGCARLRENVAAQLPPAECSNPNDPGLWR